MYFHFLCSFKRVLYFIYCEILTGSFNIIFILLVLVDFSFNFFFWLVWSVRRPHPLMLYVEWVGFKT